MSAKKIFESKWFIGSVFAAGAIIILSAVFQWGEFAGYRRAGMAERWGNSYYRTFGRHDIPGGSGRFLMDDFPNTNGALGKVLKLNGTSSFMIEGLDNTERMVVAGEDTVVRRFRNTVSMDDVQPDDFVVVIGEPEANGAIRAKLIRIVPEPPEFFWQSTTTKNL